MSIELVVGRETHCSTVFHQIPAHMQRYTHTRTSPACCGSRVHSCSPLSHTHRYLWQKEKTLIHASQTSIYTPENQLSHVQLRLTRTFSISAWNITALLLYLLSVTTCFIVHGLCINKADLIWPLSSFCYICETVCTFFSLQTFCSHAIVLTVNLPWQVFLSSARMKPTLQSQRALPPSAWHPCVQPPFWTAQGFCTAAQQAHTHEYKSWGVSRRTEKWAKL